MFQPSTQGAAASTAQAVNQSVETPTPEYEVVRHLLFGSFGVVQNTIHFLHKLNYAEPNDWSQPISTGRPNEVMAILTKRVRVA